MIAKVLQFIPPNGDKKIVELTLSDSVNDNYELIKAKGCRLTIEYLRLVGSFSLCIEEPDLGDFSMKFVSSEKDLPATFESMISSFNVKEFEKWKSVME